MTHPSRPTDGSGSGPYDVVIIGAGGAGLATARELARSGHRTVVLEQFDRGHRLGSSHGTSRIVRLAHDNADDVHDAVASLDLWRRLERDTGTSLLIKVGGLEFGDRAGTTLRVLRECGVPAELISPDRVEAGFPGIRAQGRPAVYQPDSAVARADRVLAVLAEDAIAHGAEIRYGVRASDVEPGEDRVVVPTSAGTLTALAVIIAAGPWSARFARQVGATIMPYPTVQAPVYLPLKGSRASYRPTVIERRPDGVEFYALPEPDGSMIKGGIHDPGPAADPDGARTPDPEQVEDYLDWVTTRFADLDLDRHHAEGCIYTWLPDSRFHLARYGRVILMSCCSGRGFKFLPLTGSRGAAMAREILQPSPTAGVAHGRA